MDSALRPTRLWPLIAILVATLAKLYCAATTIGTDDVLLFRIFGRSIAEHGLAHLYNLSPEFNHTPLVGLWAAFAWKAGAGWDLGQPFLMRLPAIVADVVTIGALMRLRELRGGPSHLAIALTALCPIFFIVSGFHGQVDPVMVMFLTLAAVAGWRSDALWCGLWLGCSANIKVVGLLLAPVFFFHLLARGGGKKFALGAALPVLIGWAFPLLVCPAKFLGNVLGYNSFWGLWGITYWLMRTGLPQFQTLNHTDLPPTEQAIMTALKIVVIVLVLALAWRRRNERDLFAPLAAAWAIFFAFSPGGSPHYFVWPIPFLVVAAPRRSLALLGALSIYQFLCYDAAAHGMPWFRASHKGFAPMFAGHFWADLAWLGFVAWALVEVWSLRRDSAPDREAAASAVG